MRTQLQRRLNDLEPVPELLKVTELRLQEANEKNAQSELRNQENKRVMAEYTQKVKRAKLNKYW